MSLPTLKEMVPLNNLGRFFLLVFFLLVFNSFNLNLSNFAMRDRWGKIN